MHSLTHSRSLNSPTHFSREKSSSSSSSSNANEGRSKKSSDILRVVSVEKGGGESCEEEIDDLTWGMKERWRCE